MGFVVVLLGTLPDGKKSNYLNNHRYLEGLTMTVDYRNDARSPAKLFPFADLKFQAPFDIVGRFGTNHIMFVLNR